MIQDTKAISAKKVTASAPTRVTLNTRGGGDCALHAILGQWNRDAKEVVCDDISGKREKLRRAMEEAKSDRPVYQLMAAGIEELLMSGRVIGEQNRRLQKRYQKFLDTKKKETSLLWQKFEQVLQQYPTALTYVQEHGAAPGVTTLYDQFYRALTDNDGELYGIILSLAPLQHAFETYNRERNKGFDWQSALTPGAIKEYAAFISQPRMWLLPSEIAIIADVFGYQVTYYPAPGARGEMMNRGPKRPAVMVQFNGTNHYEQQVNAKQAKELGLEEHTSALTLISVPAPVAAPPKTVITAIVQPTPAVVQIQPMVPMTLNPASDTQTQPARSPIPEAEQQPVRSSTPEISAITHDAAADEDFEEFIPVSVEESAKVLERATQSEAKLKNQLKELLAKANPLPASSIRIESKPLGNGAFGQVFRGDWVGRAVALKEIALEHAQEKLGLPAEEILESFEYELARLSTLSHPNLVEFYGVYQQDDRSFLVMELCEGGSLRSALDKGRGFTLSQQWQLAFEMIQGLLYLHRQGIVHRDLKADNILLTVDGHAKLADLGVVQSDIAVTEKQAAVVDRGLSDYRFKAPEDLYEDSLGSSPASDIFAYGLILWELYTGKEVGRLEAGSLRQRLKETAEREPIPDDCPREFKQLMQQCWEIKPQNRPSAIQVSQQLADSKLHSRAAQILLWQHNQILCHPRRAELAHYEMPLTRNQPLRAGQTPDDFWQTRDQKSDSSLTELQTVFDAFFKDPTQRVLVLVGDSGVGKTLTSYRETVRCLEHQAQALLGLSHSRLY